MKLSVLLLALAALVSTGRADTFQIDPVHSSVLFKVKHLGVADFYGRFNEIAGTVNFDPSDAGKDSIVAEVKVESVDTHEEKRNQHLKSPDFFNAKQFPTITFKSTKVEKKSAVEYAVTGDFTLHGVTKPVTFTFKKGGVGTGMKGETRMGGEAEFSVKRSDYGMTFMQNGLGDEVGIILSLEGVKQ
jgi:polyisoprenoid-binding protein YceI